MRFLRQGETTLPEFWQDYCRSKCHDMLGHILEWFYAAVLGVTSLENAYKIFSISPPYVSEFDHVKGSFDCPYRIIKVDFQRRPDKAVLLQLTIPVGTTARLRLPQPSSSFDFDIRPRSSEMYHASSKGIVELHSGGYYIVITASSTSSPDLEIAD
jgi:hypothetical protein